MTTQEPSQNPNQEDQEGDCAPVRDAIVDAVRQILSDGPTSTWARVNDAIIRTCPEIGNSWAIPYVCELVASGKIPEADVAHAIADYLCRLRQPDLEPVRDKPAYMSTLLGKVLARHGYPWKMPGDPRP